MNVVIRTDASVSMGMGHAMRCLSLADALRDSGATCTFLSAAMPDAIAERIAARGHEAVPLPAGDRGTPISSEADAYATRTVLGGRMPDWLVVDHYGIDARWHASLRSFARRMAVIDDLADRHFDADLLVNQNAHAQAADYAGLLPRDCQLMLGPEHALLAPGFAAARPRQPRVRPLDAGLHVVITMGGTDPASATLKVLEAVAASPLPPHTCITVVLGSLSPCLPQVRELAGASRLKLRVAVDVNDMAALLSSADIAIAAAGSTVWELCCLAVPTIAVITARNQRQSACALADRGAVLLIDELHKIARMLPDLLQALLREAPRRELASRARPVSDGLGSTRVAAVMHRGANPASLPLNMNMP